MLAAAQSGELNSASGLKKQTDRLMASPRLDTGVRAFFSDMLAFDGFDTLSKDAAIYPKFTSQVLRDAQEQTMRTIVDHLLTQNADYRDLFTTHKTFLTPLLASIYKVPATFPEGVQDPWVAFEYPKDAPQAGILTQASFVGLHSHPGPQLANHPRQGSARGLPLPEGSRSARQCEFRPSSGYQESELQNRASAS